MKEENKVTVRVFVTGIGLWLLFSVLAILLRPQLFAPGSNYVLIAYTVSTFIVTVSVIMAVSVYTRQLARQNILAAESLRDREELSRVIYGTVSEGIVIYQNDTITEANKKAAEYFGYALEELIGKKLTEFIPRDLLDKIHDEIITGGNGAYTAVLLNKNKRKFTGELSGRQAIYRGSPASVLTIRDITKYKEIEEELRAKAELLELSSDAVSVYDFRGNPVYLNDAYCKTHGYSHSEIMRLNLMQVVDPEYNKRAQKQIANIRQTGKVVFEDGHRRKDGSIFILELHASFFTWGDRELVLSIGRDITERKHADELLENITSNSPVGMFILQHGKMVFVNQRFCQDTGYSREELLAGTNRPLVHPDDQAHLDRETVRLLKGERKEPFEFKAVNKDGSPQWVITSVAPIQYRGARAIMGTALNITHRKAAEDIAKLNENRLKSLVAILQQRTETTQEFLDYALNEAVALTESKMGFIYFYNDATKAFTLHAWSKVIDPNSSLPPPEAIYQLEKTGVWGEAVRQKKPILINNLGEQDPRQPGYPAGAEALNTFMAVPIISDDRTIAVVAMANKESQYLDADVLQLTLLMETVWKVVDRKKAEEALKASEKNYRNSVSQLPSGIQIIDREGKTLFINQALMDIYGYADFEEFLSMPREKRYAPRSYQDFLERRELRRRGLPTPTDFEIDVVRKDGAIRSLYTHRRNIVWDGAPCFELIYED
ncbi:MAG: PAS domain S-box protein, partial [Dehalococcoidales bacterium]|nr:PAS domain S-box protein [Dehalococcoidales bacterium]